MTKKTHAQVIGTAGETYALQFLLEKQFELITQNFRCKAGEIDLIMRDDINLVFIEVRTRRPTQYGDGADSITPAKQRKLIKTAAYFLTQSPQFNHVPARFDVLDLKPVDKTRFDVDWIPAAFCAF